MRSLVALYVLFMSLAASVAGAEDTVPEYVKDYVPNAVVAGTARVSYMLVDLYDATLYKPMIEGDRSLAPLALRLTYKSSFSAVDIVDRSISKIRDQGFHDEVRLAAWHESLRSIIPDVQAGSALAGILTARGETLFYADEKYIGKISDPTFGKHFFDIWLNRDSDEPIVWNTSLPYAH